MKKTQDSNLKKAVSLEGIICIVLFILFFASFARVMGLVNFLNTLFNTAYTLLLETVFYLLALNVIAGGMVGILTEFGVISMANKFLSPFMNPIFDLPGAGSICLITTYVSDNPALLTLGNDKAFRRYFKKYQLPAIVNMGTGFGMGLIVTVFMIGLSTETESYFMPAMVGNLGALIGTIVSTRLMTRDTKKHYGTEEWAMSNDDEKFYDILEFREVREGSVGKRFLSALLEGGKSGVSTGVSIIPGVLLISSLVLMLTFGPGEGGVYTGAAYEGVEFLPWLGEKLSFILSPLFGFTSPGNISVPLTALGASSAAIGIIPKLLESGLAHGNDIAVFTATAMCLSGFLSTHVAMMDALESPELTGKAIKNHAIGSLIAGIAANLIYKLIIFI